MTVPEAAAKWGVAKESIRRWARHGLFPGCSKVKIRSGYQYILPDDAEPPPKGAMRGMQELAERERSPAEREDYIAKYGGTLSVKAIAERLGIPAQEVRLIYDRLIRERKAGGTTGGM